MRAACSSAQAAAILPVLPGGFGERGEGTARAGHDRMKQGGGHQRAQAVRAQQRDCLFQAFDRLGSAGAVKRAVGDLQQAAEQRAVLADDPRHVAHRVAVAVDGAHELRQQRRAARQVFRLQLEIAEHARGGFERGKLRGRRLVAQFAEIRVERVRRKPLHGHAGVDAQPRAGGDAVRGARLRPASLPILGLPRWRTCTRPAQPLTHKRADSGAESDIHGLRVSAHRSGTEVPAPRTTEHKPEQSHCGRS